MSPIIAYLRNPQVPGSVPIIIGGAPDVSDMIVDNNGDFYQLGSNPTNTRPTVWKFTQDPVTLELNIDPTGYPYTGADISPGAFFASSQQFQGMTYDPNADQIAVVDRYNFRIVEFDPAPTYQGQFNPTGSGPGPGGSPAPAWDCDYYSTDDVYIVGRENMSFVEFWDATTLTYIGNFATPGAMDQISVNQNTGDIYFPTADPVSGNSTLYRYSNAGVQLDSLDLFVAFSGDGTMRHVCFGDDDSVYIAQFLSGEVHHYSQDLSTLISTKQVIDANPGGAINCMIRHGDYLYVYDKQNDTTVAQIIDF
jgi:hypothetical protein